MDQRVRNSGEAEVAILRLSPEDNLIVARRPLAAGTVLPDGVVLTEAVPAAHKIASRAIAAGELLQRGGLVIGEAAAPISAGALLRPIDVRPRSVSLPVASSLPAAQTTATFEGYLREDGRVGTRNTIGVIIVGNCAATAARRVADWFDEERLASFPNVDAVVPYIHEIGCGIEMTGEPMDLLRRTLSGFIRHPNTFGSIVMALGCERNNLKVFMEQEKLAVGERLQTVTLQEVGGVARAVEIARGMIEVMLPEANKLRRQTVPVSKLTIGLQSANPDGFSGISADPALGMAVDILVAHGGTAILSQTPDVTLAGEVLVGRTANSDVAVALRGRIDWWREYNRGKDTQLNGVLDRGDAQGGLASVQEKALGAMRKAGATPLMAAYRYAQPVEEAGLVFMDGPDYEPVTTTGQIASGATLIAMTTGRGTAFGSQPAPTVKIAASTETYLRMQDDIDFDAGPVLDGAVSVEAMGRRIFEVLLRHASGERTKGEVEGVGENEFVPWPIGVFA